uniref:hypothetical protein n=1 Tax=Rhodococcus hoagii TaxID=43767 RepID=UPI001C92C968
MGRGVVVRVEEREGKGDGWEWGMEGRWCVGGKEGKGWWMEGLVMGWRENGDRGSGVCWERKGVIAGK